MGSLTFLPSILLLLLSMPLLFPIATSDDSPLLQKICANNSRTYSDGNAYAKNIKYLLDLFYNRTSSNNGFMKESWGPQGPGDVTSAAYGLALCRGDVSSDDCDDCLYDARCKITRRCNSTAAMVWYDNCQVRYSDENFFGKVDTDDNIIMINVENMTNNDAEKYREMTIKLLTDLSNDASSNNNKKMFAGGDRFFNQNVTVHGMAFCTRDLSSGDCKKCLKQVVKELPIYKREVYSVGGRVVAASCTVRYEQYVFLNSKAND
ncbi:cysteine-rich receptor-like protein kinase 25 [Striga asiatica]|uniref:Cysteine-rich receptor-like protein kinase 25 n=1 Tax=Striga asiatica TaxID=4170 RepID=A0A5A7QSI2_STRAF|nr:cysteine-rich receptor-like protein kinase 25 [Striga asiatica]